jgi:catechol 2,3-dioxygenase-like lactoylglutathione lyase family enzyme
MIFVPDISKARQFYLEVLGFKIAAESKTHLSFAGAGCEFIAYKCEKSTASGDYANEARAVLVFEVPDLDSALAHLRAHHVTVLHATPGQNESGRYAAFVDPFGIVHEIFEPKSVAS